LGFAQPKFTEATLNDLHQAFVADPPKTVAEKTLPTFTLVGSDGQITEYAVFKTWNVTGAGLSEWPTSDVKVQQSGNFAIAKGITMHKPRNAKAAFHQRFVETYEFQNGQWMMASAHYTDIAAPKADDEAAVKAVIEKETQSWHDRNADGRIECIANVPYAVMLVHHGVMESTNGVAYVTNEKTDAPERLKTQMEGMGKPNGSTFKNENYVVTIKGRTAFVSFHEITTAADGKKTYGHGVRNLEKIDGLWRLTYIGGVIYKRD
jgi:hypothetical protein